MIQKVNNGLNQKEIQQYFTEGYVSPRSICSPEEMNQLRERVEKEIMTTKGIAGSYNQSRHIDSRLVYDLCTHPVILESLRSLFGENLILWRSNFFIKQPGEPQVPWHQDGHFYRELQPSINITVWLALNLVNEENSCVQIVPGSHRQTFDHQQLKKGEYLQVSRQVPLENIEEKKIRKMELQPGEFFIFQDQLLHYSAPNSSMRPRFGLAIRYTLPFVKVDHDGLFEGHGIMVASGKDPLHLNRTLLPPEERTSGGKN